MSEYYSNSQVNNSTHKINHTIITNLILTLVMSGYTANWMLNYITFFIIIIYSFLLFSLFWLGGPPVYHRYTPAALQFVEGSSHSACDFCRACQWVENKQVFCYHSPLGNQDIWDLALMKPLTTVSGKKKIVVMHDPPGFETKGWYLYLVLWITNAGSRALHMSDCQQSS